MHPQIATVSWKLQKIQLQWKREEAHKMDDRTCGILGKQTRSSQSISSSICSWLLNAHSHQCRGWTAWKDDDWSWKQNRRSYCYPWSRYMFHLGRLLKVSCSWLQNLRLSLSRRIIFACWPAFPTLHWGKLQWCEENQVTHCMSKCSRLRK